MTWTAPEAATADEGVRLPSLLAWHRGTFLRELADLTGEQLATTTTSKSSTRSAWPTKPPPENPPTTPSTSAETASHSARSTTT
ncbi:MAG TPA: hypothetical protein VFG15_32955 [Amycolatopsis sp.]|nr:hypothetical protein [Amycolatopsis sp.]